MQRELAKGLRKIVVDQVTAGIIEKVPDTPTGERVFYMPHKPVVKQEATTTSHNLRQATTYFKQH